MQDTANVDQTVEGVAEKVVVACSYCGKKYLVESEKLGRHTTCSKCGQRFALVHDQSNGSETVDSDNALEVPQQEIESIALEANDDSDDGGVTLDASTLIDKVAGIETLRSREHTDRYEMGGEIARGGMGSIIESRDQNLRRNVAMKIILPSKMTHLKIMRFIEEAQITGQLEHPNIVPVHELGIDNDGQVFYTMKMVNGKTLSDILTDLARGEEEALQKYKLVNLIEILSRVCDALSYAHSKGVVHRDLKPENIMIGDFGEVQVMDWGLAKILSENPSEEDDVDIEELEEYEPDSETRLKAIETVRQEQRADITLEGNILGTPQYMAPEQAEGKISQIDQTTDIYALGGIFYEILTLRPPVRGENVKSMIEKVIKGDLVPPVKYNNTSKGSGSGSGTRVITRRHKPSEHEVEVTVTEEIEVIHLKHCPHRRIPKSLSAVCMKAMSRQQWQRYQQVGDFQRDLNQYLRGYATEAEGASSLRRMALFFSRHKSESGLVIVGILIFLALLWSFVHNLQISEQAAQDATKQAEQARITAESEQELSRQTIERLKSTVPTFIARAEQLVKDQEYDQALECLNVAVDINNEAVEIYALQGQIYQTLLRFNESIDALSDALSLKDSPETNENLALSKAMLEQQQDDGSIPVTALRHMHESFVEQGRQAEAITILSQINADAARQYKEAKIVLEGLRQQGLIDYQLDVDPDTGLLLLAIKRSELKSIDVLQGMPLVHLSLINSDIGDITLLADMPLRYLELDSTSVSQIRALKGMRLQSLSLSNTPVSNIADLEGAPIAILDLSLTLVKDIRYLKDMPLRSLNLMGTKVTSISHLSELSLEYLNLEDCAIRDLRPLKNMKSLKTLILPNANFDIEVLREMKHLQTIGFNSENKKPIADFWSDWDKAK